MSEACTNCLRNKKITILIAFLAIIAASIFFNNYTKQCKAENETVKLKASVLRTSSLGKVTGIKAKILDGGVSLSWDRVKGAAGYCIFRLSNGEYRTYKFTKNPGKAFYGLKNGTEYKFAAAAYIIEDEKEKYGEFSDIVAVTPENNTLKLSEKCLVLKKGSKHKLQCLLYDKPQKVSWKSSKKSVATVGKNGTVRAKGRGKAIITATDGKVNLTCTVYVDRKAPKPRVDLASRYKLGSDGIYRNGGKSGTASLMFTGDLMAMQRQMQAAQGQDGTYDFFPSFARVEPLFKKADLVAGNLETTLSQSFPYSIDIKTYMGFSNCNTVSSYLDALKKSHFDLLVTAITITAIPVPKG